MKLSLTVSFILASLTDAFSARQLNQKSLFRRTTSSDGGAHPRCIIVLHAGKIGIFYGTSTGNTSTIAGYLAAEFGDDADEPIEIDEIQGSLANKFAEYEALVVGTPTWNTGADTERSGTGWDEIYYGEMQGRNTGVDKLNDRCTTDYVLTFFFARTYHYFRSKVKWKEGCSFWIGRSDLILRKLCRCYRRGTFSVLR